MTMYNIRHLKYLRWCWNWHFWIFEIKKHMFYVILLSSASVEGWWKWAGPVPSLTVQKDLSGPSLLQTFSLVKSWPHPTRRESRLSLCWDTSIRSLTPPFALMSEQIKAHMSLLLWTCPTAAGCGRSFCFFVFRSTEQLIEPLFDSMVTAVAPLSACRWRHWLRHLKGQAARQTIWR